MEIMPPTNEAVWQPGERTKKTYVYVDAASDLGADSRQLQARPGRAVTAEQCPVSHHAEVISQKIPNHPVVAKNS
jgi:hypothetical protein